MANFKIIKDLVWERKISLKQLASEVNMSETNLQMLMKNNSTNTTTIEKIANYLGVPVGVFFDEKPIEQISTTIQDGKIALNGTNHGKIHIGENLGHEMEMLRAKVESLEKEVAGLQKQIGLYEKLLERKG